jgi:hypothetical protein
MDVVGERQLFYVKLSILEAAGILVWSVVDLILSN